MNFEELACDTITFATTNIILKTKLIYSGCLVQCGCGVWEGEEERKIMKTSTPINNVP